MIPKDTTDDLAPLDTEAAALVEYFDALDMHDNVRRIRRLYYLATIGERHLVRYENTDAPQPRKSLATRRRDTVFLALLLVLVTAAACWKLWGMR